MNLNIDLSHIENQNQNQQIDSDFRSQNHDNNSLGFMKLAVNLENISKIEEERQIISEFDVDEGDINRLVAAIGAGFAAESVINARILANAHRLIQEAKAMRKTVVRQGKLVNKTICPEGFKVSSSGMCERMNSKDIIAYKRRAKKAAMTRARHKPTSATMKMRKRSLLVRDRNEGRLKRITAAAPSTQVR